MMSLLMACTPEPTGPPDLVLISLDTTRADRFGERGVADTPSVDRLAAQSRTFPRATTVTNNTLPAHVSMLSGLYPQSAGVPRNGHTLPDSTPWLAEHLAATGYDTAAFVSASALAKKLGLSRGFDHYDDTFDVKELDQRQRHAEETVNATMAWIAEHEAGPSADTPYFVWVHLFDPHYPYTPPEAWLPQDGYSGPADGSLEYLLQVWGRMGRDKIATTPADRTHMVKRYDAEMAYMDTQLGRLFNLLGDGPMIALTADHGESLTEHDYLFDHGDYLYDASLRVPLIVRYPAVAKAGHVADCQVSTLDLPQTLLALLSLDDDQVRFGRDLGPALRGEDCEELPVFSTTVAGRFVEVPPVDHAVRLDGYKLIRLDPDGERTNAMAGDVCFDLAADPGELRPLDICPPRFEEILGIALSEGDGPLSPAMDAQTRAALEALGYLEFEEEHRQ